MFLNSIALAQNSSYFFFILQMLLVFISNKLRLNKCSAQRYCQLKELIKMKVKVPNQTFKPRFKMPLLLNSNMTSDKFAEKIHMKLHRDPSDANFKYYQKTFKAQIDSSTEECCRTQNILKEIITNLPINTKAELKIHAANVLRQVNTDNLLEVIDGAPNNASIEHCLQQ